MAEELPDAPWATNNAGNDDLPDDPWVTAQKPSAGGLSNSSDDGFLSSAAKGAATAGIKGIANSIGTVGNLGNFADYLIGRAHSAITGRPFEEVAADLAARKAASARVTDPSRVLPTGEEVAKPILERTGEYKPESLAGRLGMAGVEAAAGMIGPGGGAVTKGTSAGQALISTPTKLAPVNALAGATGQGVTEATGDPLIGMAAGIGAPAAASAARRAVQPTVDKMIAPFAEDLPIVGNRYAGTRENLVRQQIEQSANDLGELQRQLMVDEPGPLNQELVPGSQPTTGQLTGDKGVLSAEREKLFDAKDQRFLDRMEAQEGARRAALEGQGPGGDVDRPSAFFQNQLETIQRGADEAVARITAGAEQLAQRIGHGESPENLGATLRASLERVKRSENEARRKLYDAVDPDGSLNLVSVPVRDAAAKIKGGVDPYGTPLSQVENDILARMASLPDVAPYKSLQALDTYITGEMKRERMSAGESPSWRRLTQMKKATMDAINDAVDNQIAYERAAVSAGKLAPENTTSARLEAIHDEYLGTLGRPREAGDAAGENAAASASGVPDVRGEAGARAGRSGRPAGAAAVPGRVTADTLPLNARRDIADARRQYGDAVANRLEAQLVEQARNAPQSVYYPGGELKVRYEVVDLPSLKTSHDTQFNLRKDYPQELQPRARESAPARDQVNNMAARLQPERLGPSPEANSGAPIVGPDGIVESGNGRTLAIAKAYQKGNTAYRDWLESQGYDTAGMSQPVLIARRVSDMTPAQREFFTNSANASSTLRMSAAEQAAGDAKVLRPDMLAQIVDGPIRSVENRPFVRSFVEKLPAAERGGILDKDGNLSQAGVKRVEAALAARAFDDAAFVARAFDSADSNIRGLAGALTDAAGPWARMREAARDGTIDASHDITSELMNVVHKVMRARDEGRPVGEVLRQNDMFGSDVAPLVESLLFRDPEKGLLAGRQKIAQALKLYAGEAEKNLAGPRLFDDGVRPRDVLKAALEKAQREIVEDATFETGAGERVMSGRQPNFTDAARDRLRAAKDSHIRYTETFKNRPVGPVLKGPFKGRYDLPDSAVPSKAVVAGPKGYETARAFIKAAGNDPVAIGTMLDQALAPLRKPGALLPSGALKPAALEKWKSDFAPALRALDEVNPGFSRQFDNAARATELMVEAGAMALAQRKALQQSEAAKFLKSDKPQDALWSIFTAKDGPRRMRELLRGADPDVVDGLRQIGVDAMLRKLSATAESGTSQQKKLASATFQKFIRDNGQTLSAMYEPRTMNMLRSIATDLERTSRTMGATSIPGQSNTARDLPAKLQKLVDASKDKTLLGAMAAGAAAGYLHTGSGLVAALSGVFGGAAKHVFAALRARGMDKVDEMFKDALLNPERARYYLQKAPLKSGGPGPLDAIARSVRRELMVMPAIDDREGRPFLAKRRADGGAVDSDDPFERAAARTRRAVVNENRADEVMGHKIWAHLGQSLMDAVMAPGDAMKGKFSTAPAVPGQWSDEDEWRALINQRNMDNRAFDLAGLIMSGGVGGTGGGAGAVVGSGPVRQPQGIRAYHGSPHDFDRFDLSKIGTGEGAQAYGHGLYFAENKAVADGYKTSVTRNVDQLNDIARSHGLTGDAAEMLAHQFTTGFGGKRFDDWMDGLSSILHDPLLSPRVKAAAQQLFDKSVEASDAYAKMKAPGRMYEVNINAKPEQFLDWDRPVAMNSPLRERVADLGMRGSGAMNATDRNMAKDAFLASRNEGMTGSGLYNQLTRSIEANRDFLKSKFGDEALFAKPTELARRDLLDAGIPGIRYLDQGSRSAADGTRNYVVFDDKLIDILRKYGLAGMLGGAGAMAATDQSEASSP